MTSNQALLEIYLEAQFNKYHFTNDELVERAKIVSKDLELLSILKKSICTLRNDILTKEEYQKIKEWLDNERK